MDDKGLRYFIPVNVNDDFNLLGVWTNPYMDGTKTIYYPKEITKYYEEHNDSGFFNEDMIICGDFNCDVRLKGTHAKNVYEVIEKLSQCGLVDIYHHLTNEINLITWIIYFHHQIKLKIWKLVMQTNGYS